MKKIFFTLGAVICFACTAAAQDEPSLIFKADFDNLSSKAQKAAGYSKSVNFEESLALRMFNGVREKGNALRLTNKEKVIYNNFKNHNPRKGTISLWVASENWKPSERTFQVFFQSRFPGGYNFLIYKYYDNSSLRFAIFKNQQTIGIITVPIKDIEWSKGRWHKIDAVWDENMMAFYLDGVLAKQQAYTKNPLRFRKPLHWPDFKNGGTMSLGLNSRMISKPEDATAYDDFRIYDRTLSAAEIRLAYEKVFPSLNSAGRNEFPVVPGKNIKVDGVLDKAEWQDADCLILRNPVTGNHAIANDERAGGLVYLKYTPTHLLVGAELKGGEKYSSVSNDITDIWRDDSFELHFFSKNKVRYQFIVNSSGSLYDADMRVPDGSHGGTKANTAWNSGAKVAAKRLKGKWCLEMMIPRKSIEADTNEILANICASRYVSKASNVCWNAGCQFFFDEKKFGTLRFVPKRTPVRLERLALENGVLKMTVNPEVKVTIIDSACRAQQRPPGKKSWEIELASGIYDVNMQGKGFKYSSPIIVDQPLTVAHTAYPSKNIVNVKFDCAAAGAAVYNEIKKGNITAEVVMLSPDNVALASKNLKLKQVANTVVLPLPKKFKPGKGTLKVALKNGNKVILESKKTFRFPDMTPFINRVAADHSVPHPWTPVRETADGRFAVWNRIYTFGKGPFPVQVESEGQKMLVDAPELFCGGKNVEWSNFKVAAKYDDEIHFTGTGKVNGLKFSWKSVLGFDGAVIVDLQMSPADAKTAEVKDLKLKWAVPASMARAMLDPFYSKWRNRDGEVYRFSYSGDAAFCIWTVGVKKGFIWWRESPANWKIPKGHKPFTMSRKGDKVSVNADFIVGSAKLSKSAAYKMVFMATPGRPQPERRRDFNVGLWGRRKHETIRMTEFLPSKTRIGYATDPWPSLVPLDKKRYRRYIDNLAKTGVKYMPYTNPMSYASIEDSYDYFSNEWRQTPGFFNYSAVSLRTGERYTTEECCGGTGAEDLYVYRADRLMHDFPDLPGIYYDIVRGRFCANNAHGHGGVDVFGQPYSTANLLGLRSFYIRIKRVLNKYGKDKILFLHAHNVFVPFAHGLGDYWYPGEQYTHSLGSNIKHFYCENIPLKEYQSAYYSPIKGSGIVGLGIYWFVGRYMLKDNKSYTIPPYTISMLTPFLLHDTNISSSYLSGAVIDQWWSLKHDIDLAAAEFYGYWFDDAAKSSSDKVYVSRYVWQKPSPYEQMLVIGNISRTAKKAAVKLDLKKMGLAGRKVTYYDLWNNKPVSDLDSLSVGGNNFLLIGIKSAK